MRWRKDETIFPAGDVGGEEQVSEGYSVRFYPVVEPVDGRHALITVNLYAAYGAEGRYSAETQTEYMICTDLDDVGGTEEWSDIVYEDSVYDYPTVEEADAEAKRLIEVEDADWYIWDGRSREMYPYRF